MSEGCFFKTSTQHLGVIFVFSEAYAKASLEEQNDCKNLTSLLSLILLDFIASLLILDANLIISLSSFISMGALASTLYDFSTAIFHKILFVINFLGRSDTKEGLFLIKVFKKFIVFNLIIFCSKILSGL